MKLNILNKLLIYYIKQSIKISIKYYGEYSIKWFGEYSIK